MGPEEALRRLKEGNARFVSGRPLPRDHAKRRKETADFRSPFAVAVSCSDARSTPEFFFDTDIGELFVVRSAGHVLDEAGSASVRFAVERLGAPLVVVVGHTDCGAVAATLAGAGAEGHPFSQLVGPIASSLSGRPAAGYPGERAEALEEAVARHASASAARLAERLEADGTAVPVLPAVHELATGRVTFL